MAPSTQKLFDALIASSAEMSAHLVSVYSHQDWRPAPNEWSFREIAAHMRQVEIDCWWRRIQLVSAGKSPAFGYYVNSGWDFSGLDLLDSVHDWGVWRKRVFGLVERLTPEQLSLSGTHQHFGELTPINLLELALEHDKEHIAHFQSLSFKPVRVTYSPEKYFIETHN